ncbi:FOXRED1 [Lepeophtheirus salmonis]|uniref:FAD-dependent oxidoreductase domain-containing protein 1 n=1 Tax=Lepeophtheirus salmonis TaxID=72036 RepID=A0A7R8CCE7_LEPSM|nr:FOXRED1 [Lepeophtheirus salmonis]CAF2767811.1 FOXRED1 [Lepeophtheirus salmonis]
MFRLQKFLRRTIQIRLKIPESSLSNLISSSSLTHPPPQRVLKPKNSLQRLHPRDDPYIKTSNSDSFNSFLDDLYENDKVIMGIDRDTGHIITTPRNPQYSLIKNQFEKPLESSYGTVRPIHGINRALDQLSSKPKTRFYKPGFRAFYDIIIVGGFQLAIIERDLDYRNTPTVLSVGGIRQQFSTPENVLMSLQSADFYRHLDKFLFINGQHLPTVHYQPHSYLYLASEEGASQMEANHRMQISYGAKSELLSARKIKDMFPWINTDGIAIGSLGMENEGFIDSKSLLQALKIKCIDLGADFIHGEVHNMVSQLDETEIHKDSADTWEDEKRRMFNRVSEVHVELTDGDVFPIHSSQFVIAGGAESGHLAYLAGIGAGSEGNRGGPGLDTPMVVDPSGPKENDNLDVDLDYFDEHIWPYLVNRIPHLSKNTKITDAWSTIYDMNLHDHNPIIGPHPYQGSVLFATGFSGQGLSLAPAVAKALSEYIIENDYKTIDVSRLHFHRLLKDQEIWETTII